MTYIEHIISFLHSGQTACTECPANKYCPNTDRDDVFTCPTGTFSAAGSAQCTACPKGYACTALNTQTQCLAGTYSIGSQVRCLVVLLISNNR